VFLKALTVRLEIELVAAILTAPGRTNRPKWAKAQSLPEAVTDVELN
jgi:hypothetical protein